MLRWMPLLAILTSAAPAQDAPRGVDQKAVDEAIDRGAKFLLEELRRGTKGDDFESRPDLLTGELVLLTLAHAGVPAGDETFARLLRGVLSRDLSATYNVALQAMALERIDRRLHQKRIAACGQYLVDSQCANGQWNYGEPMGAERPRADTPTSGGAPAKKSGSTEALPAIDIVRRRRGPPSGDNSNTQYAILGLRACMEASVRIPAATFAETEKWFERKQSRDGGWSYDIAGMGGGPELGTYGSMTAGAAGTLVICKYYLKKDHTKSPSVHAGLKWLEKNFAVGENPGCPMEDAWHYYYLYALERAAMLYGTETIGRHEWYAEGATYLLKRQSKDGSWSGGAAGIGGPAPGMDSRITDTCFAILFLRRTTKPVRPDVATGDSRKPKESSK